MNVKTVQGLAVKWPLSYRLALLWLCSKTHCSARRAWWRMCKETSRETERGRQWKRGRWRVWLMWPWLLPPATRCLGQAGGRLPQRSLPALTETTRWAPFIIAHLTRPAPARRPYPNPNCSTGDQRVPDRASARRGITSLSASSSCNSGERLSHWADRMGLWWGCEWGKVVSGGAQAGVQTKPERGWAWPSLAQRPLIKMLHARDEQRWLMSWGLHCHKVTQRPTPDHLHECNKDSWGWI